jgi:hypothetical protein
MERAAGHLLKLQADRTAAIAASEEKAREATLIAAREEGFREAMEIFGLTIAYDDTEGELSKTHRAGRRDIRQLIIKELSSSGKTMTKHEIAKAIDYIPKGTEAALKRLATAGIVQNREGHWELITSSAVRSNGQSH